MLKTRIITAIVLFIGFTAALFTASDLVWSLITLAATILAVWEWSNLIKLNKHQMYFAVSSALVVGLTITFASKLAITLPLSLYIDEWIFALLGISTIFWVVLSPIWLITRKKINHKFILSALGLLLLLATWVALDGLHNISPWMLLGILGTVWLADSAAYFAGKKFGCHKLAPEISPGKTWEGVAGAILAATLFGLLLNHYLFYSHWIIVGLWLIVILSVMGDLFESLLKRQAGLKDSSHLLPGHGGVLDRIDGLISTLPLVLFYIYFPLFSSLQLHGR